MGDAIFVAVHSVCFAGSIHFGIQYTVISPKVQINSGCLLLGLYGFWFS